MAKRSEAETSLSRLQHLVREPPREERTVRSRRLPKDLASEGNEFLYLYADEEEAFQAAQEALLEDLRFEHLRKEVDDHVWRFIAQAHVAALITCLNSSSSMLGSQKS